jgi:hypothetical protein
MEGEEVRSICSFLWIGSHHKAEVIMGEAGKSSPHNVAKIGLSQGVVKLL